MALTEVVDRKNQRGVTLWIFGVVIVLIIGRAALRQESRGSSPTERVATHVKWVAPADAERLSRESGKPIMYEFTAEWCPPCRQMERDVFADATLAGRINEGFIPVRLTDRRKEEGRNPAHVERLQNLYNVNAFPTVVFVDSNGGVKNRMQGYGGRDAFDEQLAALAR